MNGAVALEKAFCHDGWSQFEERNIGIQAFRDPLDNEKRTNHEKILIWDMNLVLSGYCHQFVN